MEKCFNMPELPRIDQPGVVQIGYFPNRLTNAMNVADIKNLADGFRIGNNGSIITTKSVRS